MDTFERWFTQDLNKPILPQHGQGLVFTGDDGTPLVGVHVTRNGAPADLSGTVSCTVIRADGTTVPVTGGTISGGDVSVVLSSACFNIRGPIGVALAVTSGSTTMTVLKAVFQVDITSTGNIIDPSGEITLDVANLIADIDAAVASIPADYSDLLAAIAPTFIASKAYAAGAYVWYNGNLYRFTAAHAAGAWTGTDAAQIALAGDVADLKSALSIEGKVLHARQFSFGSFVQGVRYTANPTVIADTNTRCTTPHGIRMNKDDELFIAVPSGFKISIVTSNNTESGWQVTDYTYKAASSFDAYVNVAKADNSPISVNDFSIDIVFYDKSSRITGAETDIKILNKSTGAEVITGWVDGSYIATSGSTCTPTSPVGNANYRHVLVSCSEGDLFTINGTGGASPRLWAFADGTEGTVNVLDKSKSEISETNHVIKAPENATLLIINDRKTGEYCYKGETPVAKSTELQNDIATVDRVLTTTTVNIPWEIGNITTSGGQIVYQNNSGRVRTAKGFKLHMFPGDNIGLSSYTGKRYYAIWTNSEGTINSNGWLSSNYTIEEEGDYVFILAESPDAVQTNWHDLADLFVISKTETVEELQDAIATKYSWDYIINPCGPKFAMHRGLSAEAPENTVPAFELAGQGEAWGIETDVWETTDGNFVCFHDATVDRMTDGTGNIAEMSWSQIQSLTIDAGSHISEYPNLKIPLLTEYLNICRRYGCVALIEIKTVSNFSNMVSEIQRCGMLKSCVFLVGTITDANNLRQHTNNPIIVLSFVNTDKTTLINNIYGHADYWVSFDYNGMSDYTAVALAHSKNIPVNVYTIDTELTADECIRNGVDIVTSNTITKLS